MKYLYDQVMFPGGEIREDTSYMRGHRLLREMRFFSVACRTSMYYTMGVADNTRRDILGCR
jgi:hypothetical protein